MAKDGQSVTRAAAVHQQMRSDIFSGTLQPGDRLKFQKVCERYQTSVGAAREALTRLVAEGLVQSQPNVGYTVTPLSIEDLNDLTEARVELECLALRKAIENGDRHWEANLVAAHHLLANTPFGSGTEPWHTDEWGSAHTAFHFALIARCPNRRILQMARSLREEAGLYQRWSESFRPSHRDVAAEHLAILEATLARDADRASTLLKNHLRQTARLIIESNVIQDGQYIGKNSGPVADIA
ncbi:GntR family transcriptional regulator [Rhodococcus sp. NPDC057014]|uniref:GntR family transcriptional regulator n=1 Tax=Rhodococcus sp. NPDC057014 TaxID=3346000 RepID=UPI003638DF34